ncbi:MAG: arginine--tRNA ligase [Firmicutes bacterium]|nr:arginine--tRNA ligase [Bacillota bacterium]
MQRYMQRVAVLLATLCADIDPALTADTFLSLLELPPDKTMGDIALPCFRMAKAWRKAPPVIAADLASAMMQRIDGQDPAWTWVTEAVPAGPYVNMKLDQGLVLCDVLTSVASDDGVFTSERHLGQTVAIDLSSPNIAKPFGVGHLRSTVIGTALANLLESDGYRTIRINHLGDWGTQFGKIITAYRHFGDETRVRANPITELNALYVQFPVKAKEHPELEEEARAAFKRMEDGDPDDLALWRWAIEVSMAEFQRTYDLLGTHFDYNLGESFYNDKMEQVIEELREKSLLTLSEGAQVVLLEDEGLPPCLIRKSDGATLYPTRDLAAALYRANALHADELIYVVGGEQRLHFQQLFAVLAKMGYAFAAHCSHVAFGLMLLDGKKMSTRKGQIVRLQEVLEEAIARARAIIDEKNPRLPDPQGVAQAVGVGAVLFNDLKNNRMHDIEFSLDKALAFEGETGPYVQYTHARACSVLRKAGWLAPEADSGAASLTSTDSLQAINHFAAQAQPSGTERLAAPEWELAKTLSLFTQTRIRAIDERDPSLIAKLALDICQAFNHFYHDCPILTAEGELRDVRLALTDATRLTVRNALAFLNIKQPAEM